MDIEDVVVSMVLALIITGVFSAFAIMFGCLFMSTGIFNTYMDETGLGAVYNVNTLPQEYIRIINGITLAEIPNLVASLWWFYIAVFVALFVLALIASELA